MRRQSSQRWSRRAFLRAGGIVSASLAIGRRPAAQAAAAPPMPSGPIRVETLTPFVDRLSIPPVARPFGPDATGSPCYRLAMREVTHRVHRDLPPSRMWSFGDSFPGPTIHAVRGQPISVDWVNALPRTHLLPIDHTIHGAGTDVPDVRASVHVHGAKVPPESDGYPEHWSVPGQTQRFRYPNDQAAATLWYHDHTMGINRLNVYAGLIGAYLIRDSGEDALHLPVDAYDVPLILADRLFSADGALFYPTSEDPAKPWVPEVFGDALLVNGTLLPYAEVEARRYRFRLINASNARFLTLALERDHGFHVVACDQGLLERPVAARSIELAPAERADIVVDFAPLAGQRVVLRNDLSAAMEFRVAARGSAADRPLPVTLRTIARLDEASAVKTRTHEIGELDDMIERPMRMLLNGAGWHMPVTENPELGTVEVWNLVNATDDTHPIHLHLVRFQILDRRPFDVFAFEQDGTLRYTGAAAPPGADEAGWKDTVRVHPGSVTRIIMRFEGFPGRYMWHCHLLEHGDNEMMRPMDVLAPAVRTLPVDEAGRPPQSSLTAPPSIPRQNRI